jgi:predicted N-acetyltransferase YhbS
MPSTSAGAPVVRDGLEYLRLATGLLQRMRVDSPTGGIWEAADVQWWSRQERVTDRHGQLFWLDEHGQPQAAVLTNAFGDTMQCDVLVHPRTGDQLASAIWRAAVDRIGSFGAQPAEFPVRPDDAIGIAALAAAGFGPDDDHGVIASWLAAKDRPSVPPLAEGYRLVSRADAPDRPYHLVRRNGPDVERRLQQCSLYQPDLDLAIIAPDGRAVGYGLFWPDSTTGVGLVEPMRTETGHERLGIASHLLAVGLDRLAASGCDLLKVANDLGIYLRAGFRPLPEATAAIYSKRDTSKPDTSKPDVNQG